MTDESKREQLNKEEQLRKDLQKLREEIETRARGLVVSIGFQTIPKCCPCY